MNKRELLVVTTSPSNRAMFKRALRSDFDLKFAESGAEALKIIREKEPSAILMDHSIEDFLTHAFIDKIRNNPVTRNLSFIIVSRESTNSFVEQAVRAGISHYIGIPFEPQVLIQKINMALDPKVGSGTKGPYFKLPCKIDTRVSAFGRISYVSPEGIQFETRLKVEPGTNLWIENTISKFLNEGIEIEVKSVSNDVYYNYPFAVEAIWVDQEQKKKIAAWIAANKKLNSPKKTKILFIGYDIGLEEKLSKEIDNSKYSLRYHQKFLEALDNLMYLRPGAVFVSSTVWDSAPPAAKTKFLTYLKDQSVPWIISGENISLGADVLPAPLEILAAGAGIPAAVKKSFPPKITEPDRLYFSKTLEDSRIKIFFGGVVIVLGELGVRIALEHEIIPPSNFQLDLKTFTQQNLRNPYIRIWPPLERPTAAEKKDLNMKAVVNSHFLGINDSQAQAIRHWLYDDQLKDKRVKIQDQPPSKERPQGAVGASNSIPAGAKPTKK